MGDSDRSDSALFYRREADECRRQADHVADPLGRHGYLCLARHYERQARLLEIETLKRTSPNVTLIRHP